MYKKFTELLNSSHSTVADLCRSTGLKESSLSNWKKRNKGINTDTLVVICKYFGVSSDWFLGLSDSKALHGNNNLDKPATSDFSLSSEERDLVAAYRLADEVTQNNICKLLDIKKVSGLSPEEKNGEYA